MYQRLRDFTFVDLFVKTDGKCKGHTGRSEKTFLKKAEKLYAAAFKAAGDVQGTENSFAGVKAQTKNAGTLAEAERMEQQGADAETVRKGTGWFRGMDGKWRFEIDDSEAEIRIDGSLSRNPDIRRYNELLNKAYLYDTATKEDLDELRSLDKALQGVPLTPRYIGDMLKHDSLYEAYPSTADIEVVFVKESGNANAGINPTGDRIFINNSVRMDKEKLKESLLHELQHSIQIIEGHTGGANVNYWKGKIDAVPDEIEWTVKKMNEIEDSISTDLDARYENGEITEEEYEKEYYSRRDSNTTFKMLQKRAFELRNEKVQYEGKTPTELYMNTAGEIEARDAASRRNLTAEERRNTPPARADENTVFAENGGAQYYQNSSQYDPETASLREQLINASDKLNKMDVVKSKNVGSVSFKNKTDAKKWVNNEISSFKRQVDRQNFGVIYFSKTDIDYAIEHLSDKYQQIAVSMLPYVLKRGIKIGEHNDHKSRGTHTITFGAPIEINGTRGNMAVTVNVHGNHAYTTRVLLPDESAFVFSDKEKTPQGMHQGVLENESLADTTSGVSDDIKTQPAPSVKTEFSISPVTDKTESYRAPETMSADEYMEQSMRTAAQERAERLRPKSRDEFKSTPAIEKIGVKVANSVGIYRLAPQLRAQNDAAKKTVAKDGQYLVLSVLYFFISLCTPNKASLYRQTAGHHRQMRRRQP